MKPNSKKQGLIDDEDYLTVQLKSKAIQNKANKELIGLFKRKLNISTIQIQIISGMKSNTKNIQVQFNEEKDIESVYKDLLK